MSKSNVGDGIITVCLLGKGSTFEIFALWKAWLPGKGSIFQIFGTINSLLFIGKMIHFKFLHYEQSVYREKGQHFKFFASCEQSVVNQEKGQHLFISTFCTKT